MLDDGKNHKNRVSFPLEHNAIYKLHGESKNISFRSYMILSRLNFLIKR